MTEQEAIEWFKNCAFYRNEREPFMMAIQALEQTQWIPVSERLPEESGEYLVTTDGRYNGEIDIAYFTATEEKFHKAGKIFAWKPLPEPYREEGEEE